MSELVVPLGRQGLLLGFIFEQGHCPSSRVRSTGATCLEQLNRTAALVSCPRTAVGWALQLPGFSCQAPSLAGLGNKLKNRRCYELASVPTWGSRIVPIAGIPSCLGT